MSFAEPNDVMDLLESCYTALFEKFAKKPLHRKPWPRMTYEDAMRRFGSDRPDTSFGMELVDLTDVFRQTSFAVFKDAIANGAAIRGIVVPRKAENAKLLDGDFAKAKSSQYDLVIDGNELGGGSIRIHNRAMQERVLEILGIPKEDAAVRFGALLDALEYGAPPEGGIATGMDRTVMILAGLANARETIAFPKTQTGYDPLLDAPATLAEEQLRDLGLRVIAPKTCPSASP